MYFHMEFCCFVSQSSLFLYFSIPNQHWVLENFLVVIDKVSNFLGLFRNQVFLRLIFKKCSHKLLWTAERQSSVLTYTHFLLPFTLLKKYKTKGIYCVSGNFQTYDCVVTYSIDSFSFRISIISISKKKKKSYSTFFLRWPVIKITL